MQLSVSPAAFVASDHSSSHCLSVLAPLLPLFPRFLSLSLSFPQGDGIDLSLLTSSLSPQDHVAEPDALWEFDQLFADVSSEMQQEMEPDEKEEGEEGEEADDENAGVAKGDGKKAAAPIRDRSNRPVVAAAASAASAASNTQVSSTEQQL